MSKVCKLLFLGFLALGVLSAVPSVWSSDTSGNYTILGLGTISCGKYLSDDEIWKTPIESWINGYLTGYNLWNKDGIANVREKTDFEGSILWIKNYCKSSPTDSLELASLKLIQFLNLKQ